MIKVKIIGFIARLLQKSLKSDIEKQKEKDNPILWTKRSEALQLCKSLLASYNHSKETQKIFYIYRIEEGFKFSSFPPDERDILPSGDDTVIEVWPDGKIYFGMIGLKTP